MTSSGPQKSYITVFPCIWLLAQRVPTPQYSGMPYFPNVLPSCYVPQLFLPLSLTDGSAASPEEVPDLNHPQDAPSGWVGSPHL